MVPSKNGSFLWAFVCDPVGIASIHSVCWHHLELHRGALNLQWSQSLTEVCSRSLGLLPVQHCSLGSGKSALTARVRFQLRVRSRQVGSVHLGFQSSRVLFFSSSKGVLQRQTDSTPSVSLRVQTDPLKNIPIRLDNHQPLRVRHLISTRTNEKLN